MSWRDSLSGYPYVRSSLGLSVYPDAGFLPSLAGLSALSRVPVCQSQVQAASSQSSRSPSLGGSGYLAQRETDAEVLLSCRTPPTGAVYLPRAATGGQVSDPYACTSTSREAGLPRHLPPPPPLKQAPQSEVRASPTRHGSGYDGLPGWAGSARPTDATSPEPGARGDPEWDGGTPAAGAYNWHRPVMTLSAETSTARSNQRQAEDRASVTSDGEPTQYRRVGDKYLCNQCTYSSNKVDRIRQHIEAHYGSKICSICGKAFTKQCDLVRHMYAHDKSGLSVWDSADTCRGAYPVPEPSEAVFRVLRPLTAHAKHIPPIRPPLDAYSSLLGSDRNSADDVIINLSKRQTNASDVRRADVGEASPSPVAETNEVIDLSESRRSRDASSRITSSNTTVTKSILEEILSDIVRHESKAAVAGCDQEPCDDHSGSASRNLDVVLQDAARRDYVEADREMSLCSAQPKPVTDTDILLALYGENLKRVPSKHGDSDGKEPKRDTAASENKPGATSARCDESNDEEQEEEVDDDDSEGDDDEDDDDDDDDEDDDDDDDVLCLVTKDNKFRREEDANESAVELKEENGQTASMSASVPSAGTQDHAADSQILDARMQGLGTGLDQPSSRQYDSATDAGQSSTDVDSIPDSMIPLPEYASVGGSIIDLSTTPDPTAGSVHAPFISLAAPPLDQSLHLSAGLSLAAAAAAAAAAAVTGNGTMTARPRPGSGFRCSICNYEGRSEKSLQKHIRAHSSSYKICRYCSKAFERPSDLARHEERHERNMAKTGGDPSLISKGQILGINELASQQVAPPAAVQEFRCRRCDFVTNRYHKLALHKRQKHSIRHCCKYCPMYFISALPLNNHMKRCPLRPRTTDDGLPRAEDKLFSPFTAPDQELEAVNSSDGSTWLVSGPQRPTCSEGVPRECPEGRGRSPPASPAKSSEDVVVSGIARLDSFRKSVLYKSVLLEVRLGADNQLVVASGYVSDDAMERHSADIPRCTDVRQADVLRLSRLRPADLPAAVPKVPSPFSIDLTVSPLPQTTLHNGSVTSSSPSSPSANDGLVPANSSLPPGEGDGGDQTPDSSAPPVLTPVNSSSFSPLSCNSVLDTDSTHAFNQQPNSAQSDCMPVQLDCTSLPSLTEALKKEPRGSPEPPAIIPSCAPAADADSPSQLLALVQPAMTLDGRNVGQMPVASIPLTVRDMESCRAKYCSGSQQPGKSSMKLPMIVVDSSSEFSSKDAKEDEVGQHRRPGPDPSADQASGSESSADPEKCPSLAPSTASTPLLTPAAATNNGATDSCSEFSGNGVVQIIRPNALRHKPARYYCQRCNYGTDAKQKMEAHVKAHDGRFICKHCNKACIKASDLYRHWVTHNIRNAAGDFVCDTCDFASPLKHVVMNHLRVHYLIKKNPFPESHNVTRCGLCGKSYTRSQLFVHKRLVHGSVAGAAARGRERQRSPPAPAPAPAPSSGSEAKKQALLLRCPGCDKSFDSQTRLSSHYENSHMKAANHASTAAGSAAGVQQSAGAGRQLQCSTCGRRFKTRRQLLCHQRTQHSLRRRHAILANSSRRNNDGTTNRYRCPYCRKRFRSRYYLADHKKLHTGERPYQCLRCGEKFALSQACQNHIKKGCPARRRRHHVIVAKDSNEQGKTVAPLAASVETTSNNSN